MKHIGVTWNFELSRVMVSLQHFREKSIIISGNTDSVEFDMTLSDAKVFLRDLEKSVEDFERFTKEADEYFEAQLNAEVEKELKAKAK